MTEIPGLRVVRAENPSPMTLDGTRTFIVGDREMVVIDPGPADADHLANLVEATSGGKVEAILLTHIHPDHAAGAPELANRTGAPIWRDLGSARHWPEIAADHWLADGNEFITDRGLLRAIATPGHSPDHHAFHWTSAPDGADAVFVGDLLMGEGDTTLVAAPEGDLAAYLRSLKTVRELQADRLLPAHGPTISDPAAAIERYMDHREERIEQVIRLVGRGAARSAREMVKQIYGDALDPALAGAAEGSVRAILAYLDPD